MNSSNLRLAAFRLAAASLAVGAVATAVPALAQYQQELSNDLSRCRAGAGPAVRVTVTGVEASSGIVRAQLYNGTKADWLVSGRWLSRVEVPAKAGQMIFCLPAPRSGTYAVAVRHDTNGNGKTDITSDGGAMSNNPSINIFNLGKPSVTKTAFQVGDGVTAITISMRYM
jgi:uncharacterized protein (DUF2141 family)